MRTPEQTVSELLDLASRHFGRPRDALDPDADMFETLGIDSMAALELLTKLENHFGVELPDYELAGVSSFRVLAERIHVRL
jgi:acyl carrier protein